IVPTFTWGLVRSNLPFAMTVTLADGCDCWWTSRPGEPDACGKTRLDGAHERNRTFDLLLTKEVLYRLSYVSAGTGVRVARCNGAGDGDRTRTISLEG